MKITIRLIVSLLIVAALVALVFSLYQVSRERSVLARDLERRALTLAESFQESLAPLVQSSADSRLNKIVNRFGNRERLQGTVIFDRQGTVITATSGLKFGAKKLSSQAVNTILENRSIGNFMTIDGQQLYIFMIPIAEENNEAVGTLAMLYDSSFIDVRLREIWKQNLMSFMILSILAVFSTVLVVRWSVTGPIAKLAEWMRDMRISKRDISSYKEPLRGDMLSPLVSEVTQLAKSLAIARKHAEEEARLRLQSESLWTPEGLKEYMRGELKGRKLFVVSNREPYTHVREGRSIKYIRTCGRACDSPRSRHESL